MSHELLPVETPPGEGLDDEDVGAVVEESDISSEDEAYFLKHFHQGWRAHREEVIPLQAEPIVEDTFGMAIVSLVRDMSNFQNGTSYPLLRTCRLMSSLFAMLFTVILQVFLLYNVRKLISSKSVYDIRELYSAYEAHMYPNATHKSRYGFDRGLPGYFQPALFQTLDEELRDSVCEIPLAHPWYLMSLLLIWTITVLPTVRHCMFYMHRVYKLQNVDSMGHALKDFTRDDGEDARPGMKIIKGLTTYMKVLIYVAVLLPQLIIALIVLYQGTRWLSSTADTSELLLNAVALEFILALREMLYTSLAPYRCQVEVRTTFLPPHHPHSKVDIKGYFGSYFYAILAISWVLLYVYVLQQVLPDYQWDVRDVCNPYLENRRAHDSGHLSSLTAMADK